MYLVPPKYFAGPAAHGIKDSPILRANRAVKENDPSGFPEKLPAQNRELLHGT
jgi:hypothetical protein